MTFIRLLIPYPRTGTFSKMLSFMNFPPEWNLLISSYLNFMEYIPLINGYKTLAFKPSRGIHQGDPLSPYLFILGIEFLTHLIKEKVVLAKWA